MSHGAVMYALYVFIAKSTCGTQEKRIVLGTGGVERSKAEIKGRKINIT